MVWCEPPERLENVLKFESSLKSSHLPLISIAQFNTNEANSTLDSTTETTSTTQQPIDTTLNTTLLSSLTINVTKLYELLANETSSDSSAPSPSPDPSPETSPSSAKVNHPHGTEIVFKCLPSTNRMKNTWTITCEDGGWIGRASKCGNPLNRLLCQSYGNWFFCIQRTIGKHWRPRKTILAFTPTTIPMSGHSSVTNASKRAPNCRRPLSWSCGAQILANITWLAVKSENVFTANGMGIDLSVSVCRKRTIMPVSKIVP